jgi:hypothetical protein
MMRMLVMADDHGDHAFVEDVEQVLVARLISEGRDAAEG